MTTASLVAAPAPAAGANPPAAPGAQLHLSVSRNVRLGHHAWVRGSGGRSDANRSLVVEERSGGSWHVVGRTTTGQNGRFAVTWRPHEPGAFSVRVRGTGQGQQIPTARGGKVTVFRSVYASYYGPGFYGGRTACGGTLTPHTLGVANKTLPCGTRVSLRYGNRAVTVPVIDRGPYVAGRTYDLTEATKNRLHFPDTGRVWSSR